MTTQNSSAAGRYSDPDDNDLDIVALWLRWDTVRIISGVLAGIVAGLFAAGVGGLFSVVGGKSLFYPIQVLSTVLLGSPGTEIAAGAGALIAGLVVLMALSVFWGVIFAQFVPTNSLPSLLGMGLAWGAFTWIFIWNLFLPSFDAVLWLHISAGVAFPICLVYGIALTSVAFFDRALRGK